MRPDRSDRRLNPVIWTLAAGAVGLVSASLFSSLLRLPRSSFVVAHALATAGLTFAYLASTGTRPAAILTRWRPGLLAGLFGGGVLIRGVLAQPGSTTAHASGAAILWLGAVYGTVDALLLNVIPVHPFESSLPAAADGRDVLRRSVAALGASLAVTALYHLGFAEFRGPDLVQPLVGNAVITAAYLVSRSPLAAILSHVIMHVAAVMHGVDSTVQLPPHY